MDFTSPAYSAGKAMRMTQVPSFSFGLRTESTFCMCPGGYVVAAASQTGAPALFTARTVSPSAGRGRNS